MVMKLEVSAKKARLAFTRTLKNLRKVKGFGTAYAFYHKSGGAKYFGFAYNHYLRIESGDRLPSEEGMVKILDALTLKLMHGSERRELLELYLRAMLGGHAILDELFVKNSAMHDATLNQVDVAARIESLILSHAAKHKVAAVPRLDPAQLESLKDNPTAFWLLVLLTETALEASVEELAPALGETLEKVEAAARLLLSEKLVEKRGSKLVSRFAECGLFVPSSTGSVRYGDWPLEQVDRKLLSNRDTKSLLNGYFHIAIDREDPRLQILVEYFRDCLRKAYMLRESKPVDKGNLYCVMARIHPIFKIAQQQS